MRTLPVGDSIMNGYGSTVVDPAYTDACTRGLVYGFRRRLADTLTATPFVGPCGRAPYQHAGVGGSKTTDWMLETGAYGKQLPGWIRAANAERVVLAIGTNDVIAARSNPSSIDLSVERMGAIVDALAHAFPALQIVVATIPRFAGSPSSDLNQLVHQYNAGLLALPSQGHACRVIQPTGAYDAALAAGQNVSADGTHPNDAGYALLARGYANALGGVPTTPTPAPPAAPPTPGLPDGIRVVEEPRDKPVPLVGPLRWSMGPRHEVVTRERNGSSGPEVLIYAPADAESFRRRVVVPWGPDVERSAKKWKVPSSFIYATIDAESGGDPRAKGPPNGIGLMQLDAPQAKMGHSDDELMDDPALNIDLGTRVIATNIARYGMDLPCLASAYNCGSAKSSPGTLWGLCAASQAYLTRVVLANNTYLLRQAGVATGRSSGGNTWIPGAVVALTAVAIVVAVPWSRILHRTGG